MIYQLTDIKAIIKDGGYLLFRGTSKEMHVRNQNNNIIIPAQIQPLGFTDGKKIICNDTHTGKAYLLKDENSTKILDVIFSDYKIGSYISPFAILYSGSIFERCWYIAKNEDILYEVKGGVSKFFSFEGAYFFESDSVIRRIQIETGQTLWQFDVKNLGTYTTFDVVHSQTVTHTMDLKKVIGAYNGGLWLLVGNSMLLCIDIHSGKELTRFVFVENIDAIRHLEMDLGIGMIFSIGVHHYFEYHINTEEYYLYDVSPSVLQHGVDMTYMGDWSGNQIFFYRSKHEPGFGLFDRQSKTVLWTDKTPDYNGSFTGVRDIKFHNGLLYVLDSSQTLNVYRLE